MSYTGLRERLRAERRAKGLSQAALARRAATSRVTIARLEAGAGPDVRAETLARVCAALDLELSVGPPRPGAGPADERRLARERERGRRLARRLAHAQLAVRLLAGSRHDADRLLARARSVVERWQRDGLCSRHYISRWRAVLAGPRERSARALADPGAWADALLQNTPLSFALAPLQR